MRVMSLDKRVVVMGGGTGSFVVLEGLKKLPVELSAIVTVADDGGSTGRLRDEFGFLPVGDMRQCLAALADDVDQHHLRELLLYRFEKGSSLAGHNLGNLILTVLEDISESETKALEVAAGLFRLRGEVIPVSEELVKLVAKYSGGKRVVSEHRIDEYRLGAEEKLVELTAIGEKSGRQPKINPKAERAIKQAAMVVLGPGDLYGSTVANLVIAGVPEAVRESRAKVVLVVSLMSLRSQTHGMTARDYVAEIEKYLGCKLDNILVNTRLISEEILAAYAKGDEYSVVDDLGQDGRVIRGDLLSQIRYKRSKSDRLRRSYLRHDSEKLATALVSVIW